MTTDVVIRNNFTYNYTWDEDESILDTLKIEDSDNKQSVIIEHVSDGNYSYQSNLIGDKDYVAADRVFTLPEALFYAHVNMGILPPHSTF